MTSPLRAAACTLAVALALTSCGGGSSNSQGSSGAAGDSGGASGGSGGGSTGSGSGDTSGGTSGGGSGSAGSGSGDTSGGGSGGGASGGSSGGTSSGGTGSGASSGDAGGTGSGSGTGSAGSGGGSSGGGSSGGTSSGSGGPCAGLVPTFPPATVEQVFHTGTHASCSVATTNPAGHVALGFHQGLASASGEYFHFFSSSGVAEDASDASVYLIQSWLSDLTDAWFHWTGSGWRGIVHDPSSGVPGTAVRDWSPGGRVTRTLDGINAAWIAPDGQGGGVALGSSLSLPGSWHLVYLDAGGATVHDVTLGGGPMRAALVAWGTGHVLVLSDDLPSSGTAMARWFDASGTALTPVFDTHLTFPDDPAVRHGLALRGLLDGRIVLYDGAGWVAAFTDGQQGVEPAPAWLQARAGKRLFVRPNGKGYVMLPADPAFSGASSGVDGELLAPDGTSCGALTAPTAGPPTGADTRTPQALFVGQDGTLLVRDGLQGAALGYGVHCAWRWWPALLQ